MRALLALSILLSTASVSAHAQTITADVEAGISSNDLFKKQQFKLYGKPMHDETFTLCANGHVCAIVWHTNSLDGNPLITETDLKFAANAAITKNVTGDITVGKYLMPGLNPLSVEVGVSVLVVKGGTVRFSHQRIRHGFNEDASQIEFNYNHPLGDGWSLDLSPAIVHSKWAHGNAFTGTVGGTYRPNSHLRLHGELGGYTGNIASDFGGRISVGYSF